MPRNINRRYVQDTEFAIWAVKPKGKWVFNLPKDKKYLRAEFRTPTVSGCERVGHPTQKSLKLMSQLISIHTNEGDTVLDPFMGSGTTGVAASLLGRKYLGIDMDFAYLELASKRREELENEEIRQAYKEMVLVDFNGAIQAEQPHHVLVGRIGSEEQWEWFEKSHTYTLPISKILSMPKLLGAEYVLAFLGKDSKRAQLCKISSVKPQVKTREQVSEMASHTSDYKPTRDRTYWLIHLEKPLEEQKGKVFNKSLLLNSQEQRGAYWIRKYEEVIKAFEDVFV
jgi:hypothetical protein